MDQLGSLTVYKLYYTTSPEGEANSGGNTKSKTSLSRNLTNNLQTFQGFC